MSRIEPSVKLALAAGLATVAVAVAAVLSGAPLTVLAANGTPVTSELLVGNRSVSGCQAHEALPRGTSALRLSISSVYGPRVSVRVSSGSRVVAQGARGSGWTADVVTVGVEGVARAYPDATVCFAVAGTGGGVARVEGQATGAARAARAQDGKPLPGRVRIEYLAPRRSWWSRVSSVLRRVGFGHTGDGSWIAFTALALMLGVTTLATRLVLRELA